MSKLDELRSRIAYARQTRTPESVAIDPADWREIVQELTDRGELEDGGPSETLGLSFDGVMVHLHEGATTMPIGYDGKKPQDCE